MTQYSERIQYVEKEDGNLSTVSDNAGASSNFETIQTPDQELAILIFGSHGSSIQGLKRKVEGFGSNVVDATLEAAIVLNEVEIKKIDLVIFDLYHRNEGVFKVAASIRRISKRTQILFLIDEPSLDELRLALRSGVLGFFKKKSPKPYHLSEIIRRVANGEASIEGTLLTKFLQSLRPEVDGKTQAEDDSAGRLSDIDREILARTTAGHNSREIAGDCGFSAGFVRNRLSAIYRAIGVSNKSQAVVFAVRTGITTW
jgi:two-component system response regulator DegU